MRTDPTPRPPRPTNKDGGVCRNCGCTDDDACPGGCFWTDRTRTLCSTCERMSPADRVARRDEAFDELEQRVGELQEQTMLILHRTAIMLVNGMVTRPAEAAL